MVSAIVNGRILIEGEFREDRAVLIDGGRIVGIVALADAPPERMDLQGDILAPGFIDTQVNGGGGVLFNDDPTVETIARIGASHRRFGTTGFLPTLISDDRSVIAQAVDAVDEAIAAGVPGVLGIHIEGPFLNVDRKGIHEAGKIRELDEAGFAELTRLKRGRTLVTLAPERTTPAMIRRLVASGVRVSAGHTNATYEEAIEAISAGLSGVTHLFNAMSPMTNRAPGMVGATLDDPSLVAGIIVDGHHVSPVTLRIALRARPVESYMLVTDAMPSVGGEEEFVLQGKHIRTAGGVCVDDKGTLAGSNLDMASAVRNSVKMLHVAPTVALEMASLHPARFLGLDDAGSIQTGSRADLVRLSADLSVVAAAIGGDWRGTENSRGCTG